MLETEFVTYFRKGYETPIKHILDMNFGNSVVTDSKDFREALDSGNIMNLYAFYHTDSPINSTYDKAFKLIEDYVEENSAMYQVLMEHMSIVFLKRILVYGIDYGVDAYVYAALNNGVEKYIDHDPFIAYVLKKKKHEAELSPIMEGRITLHSYFLAHQLDHVRVIETENLDGEFEMG